MTRTGDELKVNQRRRARQAQAAPSNQARIAVARQAAQARKAEQARQAQAAQARKAERARQARARRAAQVAEAKRKHQAAQVAEAKRRQRIAARAHARRLSGVKTEQTEAGETSKQAYLQEQTRHQRARPGSARPRAISVASSARAHAEGAAMYQAPSIGSQSEGIVETAATGNEMADNVDAWQDTFGLATDTATKGEAWQTPGDADTHDGAIGVTGGLFDFIETGVHGMEGYKGHKKVKQLEAALRSTPLSPTKRKHLQTQRKAAIGDRRTAAIRGDASGLNMVTKAAEGGMHYYNAVKNTGVDPIGISAVGDFTSGMEETRRAFDAKDRHKRLKEIGTHAGLSNETGIPSNEREHIEQQRLHEDHTELEGIQAQINDGTAKERHFHRMDILLGASDRDRDRDRDTNPHQHALRGMQAADQLSDIRTREQNQQGWKAGLAGTAAAGNFVAGAGNLTGGADLGITKVVGTTTVAATGAERSRQCFMERYRYAQNLGKAKNMGAAMGQKSNRDWGWALRQTVGDTYKIGRSMFKNRNGTISNAEWRKQNHMSTLDEQAKNFRENVTSTGDSDKYRTMKMPPRRRGGPQQGGALTVTHASALSDLATRPVHLDASRVIDAASGANRHARPESGAAARQMLDAMDVGRTGGATDRGIKGLWNMARGNHPDAAPDREAEDFGGQGHGIETDSDTKKALMKSYVNRHNLRGG